MRRRHVASIALVLATVAPGCRGADERSTVSSSAPPTTTSSHASSVPASGVISTTEHDRSLDVLMASVVWPAHYSVIEITGTADEQLFALIGENPRVSPFVLDIDAVGLGHGHSTLGAVLAVQVARSAATDPQFRASLAASLLGDSGPAEAQVWNGEGLTAVWLGSTVVVVAVRDDTARAEIASIIVAVGD